jgi:hypothetical protein
VSKDEHLPRVGKIGREPGQIEIGVDQLDQHVPPAEEEHRKPLRDPEPAASPERGNQRAGVFAHGEPGGQTAGEGAGHETAVGEIVVVVREVQGAEPILGFGHHVHVVGLTVVGETAGEGEALGKPARAAAGEARDDDAPPFLHALPPFGLRDL